MLFLSALHELPMNVKLLRREDDRGHGRHHHGGPRGGCRRGLATFWASKARPHTIRTSVASPSQAGKRSGRPVPRLPPGLRPAFNLTLQISPKVQHRKGLARKPQRPNGEWEDQTHAHRWGGQGSTAVGSGGVASLPHTLRGDFSQATASLNPASLQGHRGAWGKWLGQAGQGKVGMGPCTRPHPQRFNLPLGPEAVAAAQRVST